MKELFIGNEYSGYKVFIDDYYDKVGLMLLQLKIKKNSDIFIVTDDNVYNSHGSFINKLSENYKVHKFIMKPGEKSKNLDTVQNIYNFLMLNGCRRDGLLIAFGGGVITDITGFCAATYMRGIRYINVPTTIISETDSAIGGKVGYNYNGVKNIIGNFYNPACVFICTNFIKTLSEEEYKNGLCEVIKCAVISKDNLLKYIENNIKFILERENDKVFYLIKECLKLKAFYIERDFTDTGERHILNFGHTIGHAIEAQSLYNIKHGYAVALGILCAIKISEIKYNLDSSFYKRIEALFIKAGIPVKVSSLNINKVMENLSHDKKNLNNEIKFVLINKEGSLVYNISVTKEEIIKSLRFIEEDVK